MFFFFNNNIFIFVHLEKQEKKKMAKTQTFSDKSKKVKSSGVNVKCIKAVKGQNGSYKFNEKFVRLDDISKVTEIK